VHNAFNAAMRDALVDVLRAVIELEDGPDVVLRGNGASFSSGGDLAEFGTTPDPVLAHDIRTTRHPGLLLHELGARATARVHGSCIGAGVELPAFCARVEASTDATFRLPELAMGLIPGAGGTASVTRRIGRQATAELAITGATLDAPEALRLGLIDAIDDEPVTTVTGGERRGPHQRSAPHHG
jgi:enoyl-CoA hydratase/carnithine racemase